MMKQKKILSLLLALCLMFAFAACKKAEKETPAGEEASIVSEEASIISDVTAEEVKGVTVPEFTISVNGISVDNNALAAYPLYSVNATSTNSAGTESTVNFVGFALSDVAKAAGLNEEYIWAEASADDGYTVTYTGSELMANTTLLAITRDGSQFKSSPWFAPCTSVTTGDYLKGCVSLLLNTTEGKPDIGGNGAAGEGSGLTLTGEAPEKLDRTDKVTFSDFSFKVNDTEITNAALEGLNIYKITVVTENKNGELSESTYTGYVLSDVLKAAGIDSYASVKAVANDGYESELSADQAASEYTLVAIEKDKETGEGGTIWVAPCSESASKSYCKGVTQIVAE